MRVGKLTPRSARADQDLPLLPTVAEEAAFAAIELEVGGRQHLVAILSRAKLDRKAQRAVGLLADPEYDSWSLAKVCAYAEAPLPYLLSLFESSLRSRASLLAIARVAERTPDVAAAVMDAAIPGMRVCPDCLGAKQITTDPGGGLGEVLTICPKCRGRGEIQHVPEHQVQKTALQLAGLLDTATTKVTTQTFNQQVLAQHQHAPTDSGSYDTLVRALDRALYGEGRDRLRPMRPLDEPVEGEVF